MRKLTTLAVAISMSSSIAFAEQAPADGTLASDEAYVLVKMDTHGALRQYVSSLSFSGESAGYELQVPKDTGVQLVKVKAGIYSPQNLLLSHTYRSNDSERLATDGEESLLIEPGTVNYIGEWDVRFGKSFKVIDRSQTLADTGYRVSYSGEDLQSFAADNAWITEYPVRVAHISGRNLATSWTANGS